MSSVYVREHSAVPSLVGKESCDYPGTQLRLIDPPGNSATSETPCIWVMAEVAG